MKTLQEKIDELIFIPKHMQGTRKYAQAEDLKYDINQAIQELREEIEKTPAETWVIIDGKAKACLTRETVLSMVGEKKCEQ